MRVVHLVIGFLCFGVTLSENGTYQAGVVDTLGGKWQINNYAKLIREAAKLNIDILMLPFTGTSEVIENYDDTIKSISESAKVSAIYVVASLLQRSKCNHDYEIYDNSVIFDRNGKIISVFRKPVNNINKCNNTEENVSFATDFGVTFKHVAVEDIILNHPDSFGDLKNMIVTGDGGSELQLLTTYQYLSSWAQAVGVNILLDSSIHSGKQVKRVSSDEAPKLYRVEMQNEPKSGRIPLPVSVSLKSKDLDLSQFTVKTLDMNVADRGSKETVCHKEFCCEFYVKTNGPVIKDVYSLAVFSGVRNFGSKHYVGFQSCTLLTKNTSSDTIFEEVSISGNFSRTNTFQVPTAFTPDFKSIPVNDYSFNNTVANEVTVTLLKPSDLMIFGIYGRDYSMDFESAKSDSNIDNSSMELKEDLNEFFDYIWIRLRVLIFVFSIYVLEMM